VQYSANSLEIKVIAVRLTDKEGGERVEIVTCTSSIVNVLRPTGAQHSITKRPEMRELSRTGFRASWSVERTKGDRMASGRQTRRG